MQWVDVFWSFAGLIQIVYVLYRRHINEAANAMQSAYLP